MSSQQLFGLNEMITLVRDLIVRRLNEALSKNSHQETLGLLSENTSERLIIDIEGLPQVVRERQQNLGFHTLLTQVG